MNDYLISIFYIFLVICCLFEVTILGIAYFGADEVECNFLWCEFKTTRQTIQENSQCYQNGIKINCSQIVSLEEIFKQSPHK